ncbi:hypothetical protein CR513_17589, partial [Mucuna pruriens]
MVTMFIDTLPSPYYDKVVGNVTSNLADLDKSIRGMQKLKCRMQTHSQLDAEFLPAETESKWSQWRLIRLDLS